jgi:threonine dehydrogenase-like Zn-dependent dehydrogenase
MKAIQIVAPRTVRVVNLPIPEVKDNEVLVKVEACVTCPQWDITLFSGFDIFERPGYPKYPIPVGYPGHEISGGVVAVGSGVRKFRVGDRVATLCSGGENNRGFYCEYVNRPEDSIVDVPDNVSYEAAASMEMARYVASHVRDVDFQDLRVGVVGLGPAGLIVLQMIKACGGREIVGMDILAPRLDLARRLGATETLNSSLGDDVAKLEQQPLWACVDCTGVAAGLQLALDHTHGPVVIFGVVHGEAKYGTQHWRQRTYIVKRNRPDERDTNFVLDLWRRGELDTDILVSARMPFEDYATGLEMLMERKAIKVCFYPG